MSLAATAAAPVLAVPEYQRVSGAGRCCDGAEPVVVGGLD